MSPSSEVYDQASFTVRFEWGAAGVRTLAPVTDVLIIVDVLSFSTAVDVAVGRGALVYPFDARTGGAELFAQQLDAVLAVDRARVSAAWPYALSPASLAEIPAGTRLVLPSPNGSALTAIAAGFNRSVLAGCLRNASAVAAAAGSAGRSVGVIAAGERWPDGTLRPAFEDLVGAGAIIGQLASTDRSPEAVAAEAAYRAIARQPFERLANCVSGRELIALGFVDDVRIATEVDSSVSVPVLRHGAYAQLIE